MAAIGSGCASLHGAHPASGRAAVAPDLERDDESDAALVRRLAERDHVAFTRLYERHAPALRTYAARLVGASDADDVAQDTLLELMRTRGVGVPGDRLDRYLKTVARGLCARRMRETVPEDSIEHAEPWVLKRAAQKRATEDRG